MMEVEIFKPSSTLSYCWVITVIRLRLLTFPSRKPRQIIKDPRNRKHEKIRKICVRSILFRPLGPLEIFFFERSTFFALYYLTLAFQGPRILVREALTIGKSLSGYKCFVFPYFTMTQEPSLFFQIHPLPYSHLTYQSPEDRCKRDR